MSTLQSEVRPGDSLELDRCVRLRTTVNPAYPIAGAILLGAAGAGLGVAFDDTLGEDAPENAAEIVIPCALVGVVLGGMLGALIMPSRESNRVLWTH